MRNFSSIMVIVCSVASAAFLVLGSVDHATLAAVLSITFKLDANRSAE